MVVVDVLPEVIVCLMWLVESMGQRWVGHMGWVDQHCESWRFFCRYDETGIGYVGVRRTV